MKRVFRGKEQDIVQCLEMVLYIHYNSENIWQMAGKNILFKKNIIVCDKCMTYIAGMAHFKLHH